MATVSSQIRKVKVNFTNGTSKSFTISPLVTNILLNENGTADADYAVYTAFGSSNSSTTAAAALKSLATSSKNIWNSIGSATEEGSILYRLKESESIIGEKPEDNDETIWQNISTILSSMGNENTDGTILKRVSTIEEQIGSSLDTATILGRITANENNINTINSSMGNDDKKGTLFERLASAELTISSHTEKISQIGTKPEDDNIKETLWDSISAVTTSLDNSVKSVLEKDDYFTTGAGYEALQTICNTYHNNLVSAFETYLGAKYENNKWTSNNSGLSSLSSQIKTNTDDISTNAEAILTNAQAIEDLSGRISKNETNVSDLNNKIEEANIDKIADYNNSLYYTDGECIASLEGFYNEEDGLFYREEKITTSSGSSVDESNATKTYLGEHFAPYDGFLNDKVLLIKIPLNKKIDEQYILKNKIYIKTQTAVISNLSTSINNADSSFTSYDALSISNNVVSNNGDINIRGAILTNLGFMVSPLNNTITTSGRKFYNRSKSKTEITVIRETYNGLNKAVINLDRSTNGVSKNTNTPTYTATTYKSVYEVKEADPRGLLTLFNPDYANGTVESVQLLLPKTSWDSDYTTDDLKQTEENYLLLKIVLKEGVGTAIGTSLTPVKFYPLSLDPLMYNDLTRNVTAGIYLGSLDETDSSN